MYIEEPRRSIDWSSVLKKGILIVIVALIIFLIIWLVTKNNNNTNVNYDNNSNVNQTLSNPDAYSRDFIDNYRYFHDTAKEYFLVSELPTLGNTIKYTLQQLIDKNLILSFGYNNGTCDTEASYVTVTNTNGKYNMTTTLVCGTEVAKTTEELGCNQLCVSGECKVTIDNSNDEETVLEYRYKQAYKATETVYSCPAGYTKQNSGKNTICIKGDETTIAATMNVDYMCPDGYNKVLENGKYVCTINKNTVIDATKNVSYSCKSGYTKVGDGETAVCRKNTEKVENANVSYTYSCPSGTTSKSGSGANLKCYKSTTKSTNATAYCASGTLSNGKCVITTSSTTTLAVTKNTTYSCPSGYSYYSGSGSTLKCYRLSNSAYYNYYDYYHNTTYNGCTYSGTVRQTCGTNCTKTVYAYYCKATYSYKNGVASTTYSCPSGTTSQSGSGASLKCYKKTSGSSSTSVSYKCTSGTLKGTKCETTTNETLTPTKTAKYSCANKNATLKDNKCYSTVTDEVSTNKNVSYSCQSGFTASGSGENMKCTSTKTDKQNAVKKTEYSCPSGYTKFGLGSGSKCTKGKTTTVAPTTKTQTVTKYRYQWSQLESIDGWERTGETRKVKASSK